MRRLQRGEGEEALADLACLPCLCFRARGDELICGLFVEEERVTEIDDQRVRDERREERREISEESEIPLSAVDWRLRRHSRASCRREGTSTGGGMKALSRSVKTRRLGMADARPRLGGHRPVEERRGERLCKTACEQLVSSLFSEAIQKRRKG